PRPNIPGCTRPPHSAPGSPARNPPHRARSLAPTPGSPPSRPAAVALRARSVYASCAVGSARPRDTPDVLVCGSLALRFVAAAPAAADTRSAASPAGGRDVNALALACARISQIWPNGKPGLVVL